MSAPRMIDSRAVKHKSTKLWLWIIWLIIMVVSIVYCALSFLAFQKIMRMYRLKNNGVDQDGTLWSTLCATFIGPFTVAAFFALGTLLLLKKTVSESGLTYSYGALHWSSIWMAVVVLQSAVSLQGEKDTMDNVWEDKANLDAKSKWTSSDTALCQGAYVFAYILAICYLLLFLFLFIFRDAAKKLVLDKPAGQDSGKHDGKALTSPLQSEHKLDSGLPPQPAHPVPVAATAPPSEDADKPDKKKHHHFGLFGKKKGSEHEAALAATGPPAGQPEEPVGQVAPGAGSSPGEVRPVVVRPTGASSPGEAAAV